MPNPHLLAQIDDIETWNVAAAVHFFSSSCATEHDSTMHDSKHVSRPSCPNTDGFSDRGSVSLGSPVISGVSLSIRIKFGIPYSGSDSSARIAPQSVDGHGCMYGKLRLWRQLNGPLTSQDFLCNADQFGLRGQGLSREIPGFEELFADSHHRYATLPCQI